MQYLFGETPVGSFDRVIALQQWFCFSRYIGWGSLKIIYVCKKKASFTEETYPKNIQFSFENKITALRSWLCQRLPSSVFVSANTLDRSHLKFFIFNPRKENYRIKISQIMQLQLENKITASQWKAFAHLDSSAHQHIQTYCIFATKLFHVAVVF